MQTYSKPLISLVSVRPCVCVCVCVRVCVHVSLHGSLIILNPLRFILSFIKRSGAAAGRWAGAPAGSRPAGPEHAAPSRRPDRVY